MKFAIQDFLDDREFKNISSSTITSYKNLLNDFQNYCAENEILDVTDVTPQTIKKYLVYCQKERNNNPTSRNTKLRAIRTLFNYLQEKKLFLKKEIQQVKSDMPKRTLELKYLRITTSR